MKIIRGIIGGIIYGFVSIFASKFIYNILFIKWVSQMPGLWRSQDSWQQTTLVPINHIFSGLLAALGFAILYKGIPGRGIVKGLVFGLLISFVIWLPAEIFWYTSSLISSMLPIAGWLHHFVTSVVGCCAIAGVYGKSLETKMGVLS